MGPFICILADASDYRSSCHLSFALSQLWRLYIDEIPLLVRFTDLITLKASTDFVSLLQTVKAKWHVIEEEKSGFVSTLILTVEIKWLDRDRTSEHVNANLKGIV